jgi:hypothetical protein|tara:strand:- start:240 stop:617 length:378 start_codon:yes stop_codon:yes gene_type:complete
MANNYQLALKDAVTKIKDKRKDKWGRSKQTIYRIYGKERCINEWGSKLPTPIEIQEYKQNWVKKALDANQFFKCTPKANTIKVSNWLKNYGVNKLDYDNVYKDTIVVRDPPTFIILKLYFFEGKG